MTVDSAHEPSTTSWTEISALVDYRPTAGKLINPGDTDPVYRIHRAGSMFWRSYTTHLHTHEGFVEVFWVEQGRAIHELNGRDQMVQEGDVVFIRTDDLHRYRAPSDDFAIMNLAFPTALLEDLEHRYFANRLSPWSGPEPRVIRPATHDWARINELADRLGHGGQSRLRLDHFLLEILEMIDGPVPAAAPMPDWLVDAIESWRNSPAAMHDGVSGLAHLAGRSREHVSRVIKDCTGIRAVDLINTLRMEAAAGMLRMSDKPVARIAAEVGLANLSHFYEVFRTHFRTTPRRYRLSQRRAFNPTILG